MMKRFSNIYVGPVSSVAALSIFRRVGIIPYWRKNDKIITTWSVYENTDTDAQSTVTVEYSDFGGAPNNKELFIDAGIRELAEESLGIFQLDATLVKDTGTAVWSSNNIIIFVPVTFREEVDLTATFQSLLRSRKVYERDVVSGNHLDITYTFSGIYGVKDLSLLEVSSALNSEGIIYRNVLTLLRPTWEYITKLLV